MIRTVFLERSPLIRLRRSRLNNGNVRISDARLERLYEQINPFLTERELWQGAFELACLLTDKPLAEPVAALIAHELEPVQDGSLPGSFDRQLQVARAGLALAEYSADKGLLKRLSLWCRWIEVNWEQIISLFSVRAQPADLMEFLVRFYLLTGSKSALRLCARLRSGAMDWTTVLLAFASNGRMKNNLLSDEPEKILADPDLDEQDYQKRLCLINHGEYLADGMRYAAFSGLFSGNGQELSAGEKGWKAISKTDAAPCGGTYGAPFLCGKSAAHPVSTDVLGAWMEAFASQVMITDETWPLDEMLRIGMNGLSWAVRKAPVRIVQLLNQPEGFMPDPRLAQDRTKLIHTLARATRAFSAFYRHAVCVSVDTLFILFPLQGRYLIPGKKMVVNIQKDGAQIRVRDSSDLHLAVFSGMHETRETVITVSDTVYTMNQTELPTVNAARGKMLRVEGTIHDQDAVRWHVQPTVCLEKTHHQGITFWSDNRMQILQPGKGWQLGTSGDAVRTEEGRVQISVAPVSGWKTVPNAPGDIPVLPRSCGEISLADTIPYDQADNRLAVFPKVSPS